MQSLVTCLFLLFAQIGLDANMPSLVWGLQPVLAEKQEVLTRLLEEEQLQLESARQYLAMAASNTDLAALQRQEGDFQQLEEAYKLVQVLDKKCGRFQKTLAWTNEILNARLEIKDGGLAKGGKRQDGAYIAGKENLPSIGGMSGGSADSACLLLEANKLEPSPNWIHPVPRAWKSAGTWAYPDGGMHLGLDLAAMIGTPVLAPANGIVFYAHAPVGANSGHLGSEDGYPTGGGNTIQMLCFVKDELYAVSFCHLSQDLRVQAGQLVSQGDVIALSGNSGNSSGPHTHVEIIELHISLETAAAYYSQNPDFSFQTGWSTPGACSWMGCRKRPEHYF
jgi:murein DD-endopeptidase MepM/ murein hydrolase activator NlpD